MIDSAVIDEDGIRFVALSGRSAPRTNDLLPQHQDALVEAIAGAIRKLERESHRTRIFLKSWIWPAIQP